LVERNLAKVEVESSRLFSRSKLKGQHFKMLSFSIRKAYNKSLLSGAIANRLCTGLQIQLARFDSGSLLHSIAGVAQLVERNLAKVEVESSRLFSRSKFKGQYF
jgi:hypothetical protein